MAKVDLTREELYELVWSKSLSELSVELKSSTGYIGKLCERLNVPRPPNGYWSTDSSERAFKKQPLLSFPNGILLNNALNTIPNSIEDEFSIISKIKPVKSLKIQKRISSLHKLAQKLYAECLKADVKRDTYNRIDISYLRELPDVNISDKNVHTTVFIFSAILKELESRCVFWRRESRYSRPKFFCAGNSFEFHIMEPVQEVKRQPTEMEKRFPSWEWHLRKTVPTGTLWFVLGTDRKYNVKKYSIIQEKDEDSEFVAAKIVEAIWKHFMDLRRTRIGEGIERRKREVERLKEEEDAKKKAHFDKLKKLLKMRERNILQLTKYWGISHLKDMILEVETLWCKQNETLSDSQKIWLTEAKKLAHNMTPLGFKYPIPEEDGGVNIEDIPQGGPYPTIREIPEYPKPQRVKPDEEKHSRSQGYNDSSSFFFWKNLRK